MHVRLFSDEMETATEDGSEGLAPGSSVPRSGSIIRFFSLVKEGPVTVSYLTELTSPPAGGGRSNSDESTAAAAASRPIRFIDKNPAEHVTTIFGSAWPSSTASFSSSSSMWTMSPGSSLAGTRKLQPRPSASKISCSKMISSDGCSRRRLNRCGAVRALRWSQRLRSAPGEEGKRRARGWGCHHELPS
jgi:hypothetical protein